MKLLVGIPSFRRPRRLEVLLASLDAQQGLDDHQVSVFVADNDPHLSQAAALCAHRLASSRWPLSVDIVAAPGIAAARNRLLAEARSRGADCLAMIDDDEIASPRWLSELHSAWITQTVDVVGGRIEYRFEAPLSPSVRRSGAFRQNTVALSGTGNVMFDCAALTRIGWPQFDSDFGLSGGEDKEFLTRLRAAELRFGWAANAIVYECVPPERMSPRAVRRRAFAIGGSDLRIAARHGPRGATVAHLLKSVAVLAAALPLSPLLTIPQARLWMSRRVARAAGRIAAAFGQRHRQYGASVSL